MCVGEGGASGGVTSLEDLIEIVRTVAAIALHSHSRCICAVIAQLSSCDAPCCIRCVFVIRGLQMQEVAQADVTYLLTALLQQILIASVFAVNPASVFIVASYLHPPLPS